MAILNILKNPETGELVLDVVKHEKEDVNDFTYIHAKNALVDSIELNFFDIKDYSFATDCGASIHFLSDSLAKKENLSLNTGRTIEHDDFDDEIDDFGGSYIDSNEVTVVLDVHAAALLVGGLHTPSAKSARILFNYLEKKYSES